MNRSQLILFGSLAVIVIVALLMLVGVIPGLRVNIGSRVSATLTVWGTEDTETVWREIIAVYNGENPNVKITYVEKNPLTYEAELLDALAAGAGPDIFAFPQSFIIKHANKTLPLPEAALQFTKADFQRLFADAAWGYIYNQQIVGIPFSVDTLALYYNKDIFNSENIPNPPATWDDLAAAAERVTKRSLTGELIQGGVALGTARNVEHVVDVLSGLLFQRGLKILDLGTRASDIADPSAQERIDFYGSFANPLSKRYSWADASDNSLDVFANSKVAMVFGFFSDYGRIAAKNPRLNFAVAPFPQIKGETIKVNYGVASGYAVSRTSRNSLEAWRFLLFAGTDPEAVKFYLNATGRPPAYRQYVEADFFPPETLIFRRQVLSAKTWLQPDEKQVLEIFQTMLQSSRGGAASISSAATSAAARQLQRLLNSESAGQ